MCISLIVETAAGERGERVKIEEKE